MLPAPSPAFADVYPPEICEWIDRLPHPEANDTQHAARLVRMLAIIADPAVMIESAHLFEEMLTGINANTRQARSDNFKNFIEEAAALPEKVPHSYFNRIKHRFSEYRAPHQTPRTAAMISLIEQVEAIRVLSMQYRAHQEKCGTTEKSAPAHTKTDSEDIEAWRGFRLRRLAIHYLGVDHPPLTAALLRVLFPARDSAAA